MSVSVSVLLARFEKQYLADLAAFVVYSFTRLIRSEMCQNIEKRQLQY